MSKQVHVTDHALLRYLERVLEMDMEALRKKLERDALPGAAIRAKTFRTGEAVFVLEYNSKGEATVATVLHDSQRRDTHRREQYNRDQAKDRERRRARAV